MLPRRGRLKAQHRVPLFKSTGARVQLWLLLLGLVWILVLVAGTAFSEDDLTGGPGTLVLTRSLVVHQSLHVLRGPRSVHLLLQVLREACLHVLLEAVRGDSIREVVIQRESAPVLLALRWIRALVQVGSVLDSPAAASLLSSSLPSSCPVNAWIQLWFPGLSSQASSPAAVAVIWPGASPSSPTDQCGNLSWGQTRQRAAGPWESGYSRAHNSTLHFLFPGPPSLGKRWAVVVQGVR